MRPWFRLYLLSLTFLVVSSSWAWAEPLQIPPIPDHYVSDTAEILSPATRESLEEQLSQFERDTSNQVLVATFPDLQGEDIESFSIRLAEKWKPGQSARNNGVILIVSKNDRRVRIEAGYGLEGALPDAVARSIISHEIVPYFQRGDYNGGVQAGVQAILKATKGEYRGAPSEASPSLFGILIILAIFLFFWIFFYKVLRTQGYGSSGARGYSAWYWPSGGGSWGSSGGGGWGGGSGGGFSSGGGSFGGGGASGSW